MWPTSEHFVGERGLRERQDLAHRGLQLAGHDERPEARQRVALYTYQEEHGTDAVASSRGLIRAGCRGHEDPTGLQHGERPVLGVAADGVENNIYLGHCGLEASQLCIDHDVRAERPHELDISRQRRGNDLGRLPFRQLHGEGANIAGAPVDQHPSGAVNTPMVEHHLPGGAAHHRHRGCRGKRQALRFLGEHRGRCHRVLRIRPRELVIRHAEDRVTGPKRNP